eukprot:CAMPEP_0194330774 /NCGR_PEP_ID=MMETSP0171-20130528/53196_1 /TAXON_ID=218684 /ORGANISM="Corethron pennatum, Strain L29A3" /LENGTH=218 /DNA_ID=CAMNT_0039091963 /DNA_START=31 /DNA_END=684 /DNA_ORIENTATION=-
MKLLKNRFCAFSCASFLLLEETSFTVASTECFELMYKAVKDDDAAALASIFYNDKNDCDINEIIPDASGQTLLMNAVLQGKNDDVVTTLLKAGADVSIGEKQGYTPIHGAGFQGRASHARILVELGGMNVDDIHTDGHTPLNRACWGNMPGHAETMRTLLELGADIEKKMCFPDPGPGADGKIGKRCTAMIDHPMHPNMRAVLLEFTKKNENQEQESD